MTTVALVIDLQVDFFAHLRLAERRATLTARVNELLAAVRASGGVVIWIKQEFAPDLSDASLEAKRGNYRVTIAGTPGASLLPELVVHPGDRMMVKKRYSAFFGTGLDDSLEEFGCDRLIVAGVNTHACVRCTVVDAYQRDYTVVLARDCIASLDEEHHAISLRYMDGKLATGMRNPEILALLRKASA
jgi:nicotinamidase-related amidase